MEVCEQRRVPVISVRCGKPEYNYEYEDSAEVPAFLVSKHTYILRAEGRSMEPTIPQGNLLVVEAGAEYAHDSLVVVQTPSGLMVKRYHKKGLLTSDNPTYPPIEFSSFDDVCVIGVVRQMITTFK